MESVSNVKVATNLKKEAKKVQRQKTFFFSAQIPPAFIQCIVAIIDNHKVVFLSDMIMTLQQSLARTTITVQHSAKLIFAKFKQQAINIITIM